MVTNTVSASGKFRARLQKQKLLGKVFNIPGVPV